MNKSHPYRATIEQHIKLKKYTLNKEKWKRGKFIFYGDISSLLTFGIVFALFAASSTRIAAHYWYILLISWLVISFLVLFFWWDYVYEKK